MGLLRRGRCARIASALTAGFLMIPSLAAGETGPGERSADDAPRRTAAPVLKKWADASRRLKPLTKLQRKHAFRIRGGQYTPHELSIAIEFHAPVTARSLVRRFAWTVLGSDRDTVRLVGVPRDGLERLFYRRFELSLDANTALPREIHFDRGDGRPRPRSLRFALAVPAATGIRRTASKIENPGSGVVAASFAGTHHQPEEPARIASIAQPLAPLADNRERCDRLVQLIGDRLSLVATADASVSRYVFDSRRRAEYRGTGRLRYHGPDHVHFEIRSVGSRSTADTPGRKAAPDIDSSLLWKCDGQTVVLIDGLQQHGRETIDRSNSSTAAGQISRFASRIVLTPALLHEKHLHVFGRNSRRLLRSYRWRLLRENATHLWLTATPATSKSASPWRQLKVIVNKTTWLPDVVRTSGAEGRYEIVYVFRDWKVSPQIARAK